MAATAAPQALEVEQPSKPGRWLLGACATAVVGLLVAAGATLAGSPTGGDPVTASAVPDGVHPVLVDGVAYVIARSGSEAVAFPGGDSQGDMLQWCPRHGVFSTAYWGSIFTAEGRVVSGPARYGLTRVPATVQSDGRVRLHPERAEPGSSRRGEPDPDPWFPRVGAAWLDTFTNPRWCPSATAGH